MTTAMDSIYCRDSSNHVSGLVACIDDRDDKTAIISVDCLIESAAILAGRNHSWSTFVFTSKCGRDCGRETSHTNPSICVQPPPWMNGIGTFLTCSVEAK